MADSDDALERRLAAVERAVDGETATDRSDAAADWEDLEPRIAELERRVDELDAAVQAVRGFLGGVSAVNESVERRAEAAVAAVERLERRLDDETPTPTGENDTVTQSVGDGGEAVAADGGEGPPDHEPSTPDDKSSEPGSTPTDDAADTTLRDRLRDLR